MPGFKDRMRGGKPGARPARDDRRREDRPPRAERARDDRPRDTRPPEVRDASARPVRADDRRPNDRRPTDRRPTDRRPTDGRPTDRRPTDGRPTDRRPDDRRPDNRRPDDHRLDHSEERRSDERRDDAPPRLARINGPGDRVVYGAGPVRELINRNPQRVRAIWVDPRRADKSAGDPVAQVVTYGRQASIPVEDRERDHLDRAAEGGRHQGVVAWLGPFAYAPLDKLILHDEPAMLIALDSVEDPRNLGAVLRSAYLLGAHGAIIPEHRAAQVTPLVAKASAGASELLPIALVPNLVRALEELREMGVWRIAVHAAPNAQRIDQIDGTMAHVLVLGSEGSGVRPLVAKHCDFHAVIPMQRAGVGSFNVSVAAALALYELRRQRPPRGP
ncbi:MAG: 23S rRNA (guanosine(2251)-2'-O)-methyltransferase RlmB [Deltaproteobacteria bacterium]